MGQSAPVQNNAASMSSRRQQDPRLNSQRALAAPNKGEEIKTEVAKPREEVWVKKWVDYSSKYGLGYHLSN